MEMCIRDRDTDAFAVFDFKWTAEALANIVDNAIKYTEHGTITISVSYTHLDVYKRQVHIFAQSFGHCLVALVGVHHSG